MKPNERTAKRVGAACKRLMDVIPASDRAKIESLVERVYITDAKPKDYTHEAFTRLQETNELFIVVFYVEAMRYLPTARIMEIVSHEFGHVVAGVTGDELTDERSAQDTARRWGFNPIRIVQLSENKAIYV